MRAHNRCVRSPKSTKHCAGARKLRFRHSAHVLKNGEKSTRSPFKLTNVFKEGSGMVPGAVWNVLGCQFGVQEGKHGAQDGQLGVRNGPTWRPELALSASRHVSRATRSAERWPKSIFHRFQPIFRSFFDDSSLDFLSISARAACDEGTKAESLKEVA